MEQTSSQTQSDFKQFVDANSGTVNFRNYNSAIKHAGSLANKSGNVVKFGNSGWTIYAPTQPIGWISQSGTGKFYEILVNSDSSTSSDNNNSGALEEFKELLRAYESGVEEMIEEGAFSESVTGWIEKYNQSAIKVFLYYYRAKFLKESIVSCLLLSIGEANSYSTFIDREAILLVCLKSRAPKIRHGAIMGLSCMSKSDTVNYLKEALEQERIPLLKNMLQSIINSDI